MAGSWNSYHAMVDSYRNRLYVQRVTGTAGSLPPEGVETGAAYLSRRIAETRQKIADYGESYPSKCADWQHYIEWATGHLDRLMNPPALRTAAELELVGV